MARKKQPTKQYHSWKEMSIEDFDVFIACVKQLFYRMEEAHSKYIELFYANRITREFHLVYKYRPYDDYNDYYDWTYDSDKAVPEWSKCDLERNRPLTPNHIVLNYKLWAAYKLLCLYFFNDESLLEDLYVRARKDAYGEKEFYDGNPEWKLEREEGYGEEFTIESYTRQCVKEALAENSGTGRLYKSLLYKIQTKYLDYEQRCGIWFQKVRYYVKPAPNSILRAIFYRCFGDSKSKALKAVKEIDAKINAFLKRKEKMTKQIEFSANVE